MGIRGCLSMEGLHYRTLYFATDAPIEQLRYSAEKIIKKSDYSELWDELKQAYLDLECSNELEFYRTHKYAIQFNPIIEFSKSKSDYSDIDILKTIKSDFVYEVDCGRFELLYDIDQDFPFMLPKIKERAIIYEMANREIYRWFISFLKDRIELASKINKLVASNFDFKSYEKHNGKFDNVYFDIDDIEITNSSMKALNKKYFKGTRFDGEYIVYNFIK